MDGNLENNQTVNALKGKVIYIPTVDATLTKEGCASDAKATGDALLERVKKTDIVDNLTSEETNKPLSARQGSVIKKMLEDMKLSDAGSMGYDNATSKLESKNVQSAIDELAGKTAENATHIDDLALQMDTYEADYLSKKGGGMVKGSVKVQNAENGYGEISKNNSDTADYGTQMVDVTKDGKSAKVTVSAITGLNYTDVDGNIRGVHHEGTKPFVEYTGNGSATSRTITTKGIGRVALVYCSTHQSLVSPKGAIVVDLTTGAFSWIDSGKANFFNGNLGLGTANVAFNKADEKYYIQVI